MGIGPSISQQQDTENAVIGLIRRVNYNSGNLGALEEQKLQLKMNEVNQVLRSKGCAWPNNEELRLALIDRPTAPKDIFEVVQIVNDKYNSTTNQNVRDSALQYLKDLFVNPALSAKEHLACEAILAQAGVLNMDRQLRDIANERLLTYAESPKGNERAAARAVAFMQDANELNVFNITRLGEMAVSRPISEGSNALLKMDQIKAFIPRSSDYAKYPEKMIRYAQQLLDLTKA